MEINICTVGSLFNKVELKNTANGKTTQVDAGWLMNIMNMIDYEKDGGRELSDEIQEICDILDL